MSEKKLQQSSDSVPKKTASGSGVRSEHYGSMPDVSSSTGLKETLRFNSTTPHKKRVLPHSPTSSSPDARSFFMEKEVLESQNRKLQMEVSTLQTENKLLKEKYNRASGKISDLEEELLEVKSDLETSQVNLNQEVSSAQRKSKSEAAQDMEQLQSKMMTLVQENENLKAEILHLESKLKAANSIVDMARQSSEKHETMEAYKMEVVTLRDEVVRLKSLLEQCEKHLHDEESRLSESNHQVIQLTELKNMLQHQVDMSGGGNTVVDKQIKSLEKRLKVTEERLHQERSDRANNLSVVEDKLLTENARLQGTEKELSRQLQREKDKNCNLEQKIKDVRNENEKLRLQVPFDETTLSSEKYDIPYSSHASQRNEAAKSLRDLKHQYEQKLKQAEETAENAMSEKFTFEATYKEQLALLVKERHEAFAKLKTAEDLLEATRSENEVLRQNLPALSSGAGQSLHGKDSEKELHIKIQGLESKVQALYRSNQVMEGEIGTLQTQMEARERALRDMESELQLANSQLDLDKDDDRKQQKVDKLMVQVNTQQAEIGMLNDKYNRLLVDYRSLEKELDATQSELTRVKLKGVKAGELADSKLASSLREELENQTQQMNQLTEELEKLDNELQQSRQDLYQEQIQSSDFEGQIESLQQQFEERGQIIDAIADTEKELMAQYQVLKVTLDSVTAELKDKEMQIKMLTVEQTQICDKLQQYERKLAVYEGDPREVTPASIAEVELEKEQIKLELLDAYSKQKALEEEMQTMATELNQLQQDLISQKAEILQMSAEKGELEQHLEEIAEEHDALIQEKAQSEDDTVKLENKLQELVETLESEAHKQYGNFGEDVSPEMSEEMDTLKALLTSKNKENEMLQIKTSRQQMDLEFLQRRIELLHNDNQSNREDISRMTTQLINKMKEGVASRQLNEYLAGERGRLQNQVSKLEKEIINGRQMQQVKMTETEKAEFNKKDMIIATIEDNLEKTRKKLQEAEYENVQLRYKVEGLADDQKKLSTLNSSLENKLEAEKKIYDEKQQEVITLNHKLDLLQREHDHVLNNLNTEKQLKDKLNNDYQIYSAQNENLRQEVRDIQTELNECQRKLTASEEALRNAKQDKGVMYHEYENMVRRLSEKDQQIIELQTKLEMAISEKEKELHMQQHALQLEKTSTERELDMTKTQVMSLSSEIKQKEDELFTFGKTVHELEEAKRRKAELERELGDAKVMIHDMKILLDSHKKEIKSLQDAVSNYQEAISKVQLEKAGIEDKLHRLEESSSVKIHDLNRTVEDMKSANDGEKYYLKDNLNQTKSELQSLQSSLSSAVQTRDKLTAENLLLKRTVEETREKLEEEITARKVAGQKADSLENQLHDSRRERFLTEEKLNKSHGTVSKLEKELKSEKDKLAAAVERSQEFEATAYSNECTANARQEQVDLLQKEVNKLKQILESQKIQMNSKLKRNADDMSQQIELIDLDRNKLSQQNKQLFVDLESSRETVQMKNKENLKLHEQILVLQEEVSEMKFKYKVSEESRKTEEEQHDKLQQKVHDQEEELKKVRSFLTKKAEESGVAEKSVWHDMNKMIQDMSKQMSQHLESQQAHDKDSKERDSKVIQRYKKQMHDLNTELQTERALHKITAASLQSLEEDCVRLRQQCQAMRRRNNSASDRKYKSRMEAINEIIARSQSQAQAMLSSGNFLDDSMKSLGSPRVIFNESPDNSICSDMSFNSTIAVLDNESTPRKPTQRSTPQS